MSLSFLYWLGLGVGVVEDQHVNSTNILNLFTTWELKAGLRQHFKGGEKLCAHFRWRSQNLARSDLRGHGYPINSVNDSRICFI